MRLFVSLAFVCVLLPAVYGLKCYTCWGVNVGTCTQVWPCPHYFDRCSSSIVAQNLITKECMRSDMCDRVTNIGITCCSGDLCNGVQRPGVFVPLLLASLVILKVLI